MDLIFQSDGSQLEISDLASFVEGSWGILDRIAIDGHAQGRLNHLRGEELLVTFDQNSSLAFDFVMIGLPDINNTFLDFNFRELRTSVASINQLFWHGTGPGAPSPYPWNNLGHLDFNGQFTGYPDNFVANGLLETDMGRMIMDLSFKPDSVRGVDFQRTFKDR